MITIEIVIKEISTNNFEKGNRIAKNYYNIDIHNFDYIIFVD